MSLGLDNLSKDSICHSFPTHQVDIFTTAIIIDVVEAMRIGKSGFVHSEHFSFVVHIGDELEVIETDALVIFGQVDTSYF